MTIPDTIRLLSTSMAASKRQSYFGTPAYFGSHLGQMGPVTELFQKVLLCAVADLALVAFPGTNLVEIGSAEGKASGALAEIAQRHRARLLVVDPYNGAQEGTESLYTQFSAVCALYPETITHLRASSLDSLSIAAIKEASPSLVFIDGLHYDWAAYSDVRAAYEALPRGGVVCVDDTNHLKRDAGAAFLRAVSEGLFDPVEIGSEVEATLYSYKSWHWGIRT